MLLNELVKDVVLSEPISMGGYSGDLHQRNCAYWGVWGKERYTYPQPKLALQHETQLSSLTACESSAAPRLRRALNFTFGLCDLSGYSSVITPDELAILSVVYHDAVQYASSQTKDKHIQWLIQELYCLRKTAEQIPDFAKGKLVNETNIPEIHRKYVYHDFFKFSLINELIRIDTHHVGQLTSSAFAAHAVLAWGLGTGSSIEKCLVFLTKEDGTRFKFLCNAIWEKIEESLEFPIYDYDVFAAELNALVEFIHSQRCELDEQAIAEKRIENRLEALNACNTYYRRYHALDVAFTEVDNPIKKLKLLQRRAKDLKTNDQQIAELKSELRNIRAAVDKKYDAEIIRFKDPIGINDFLDLTTHPYFTAIQYETDILGLLFKVENHHSEYASAVCTIFKELAPFYACKYQPEEALIKSMSGNTNENLPRLVLAHHVHNANGEKLSDMATINRLIEWPLEKQVLNISSSSSNPEIVRKERSICLESGFNHYRIHARQHLKAGNQNRSLFNALNCKGSEYYLTLDDDYFVFPHFPLTGHEQIVKHNLDYYQAPLAFKGVYRLGVKYGEKADAEVMHYFESTSGSNHPRTFVLPRGTGTMFAFEDGISSVGDTGGFLINHSSEDFGQGFLSLLQENGLKGKKTHRRNPSMMSEEVLCIGEGVELSGKIMQMIRWCHGTAKIYFHVFLPALLSGLLKGKLDVFMNKQVQRLLIFIPLGMASKLLAVLVFCVPFIHYVMLYWGMDIFSASEGSRKTFYNANIILIYANIFLVCASMTHYWIVQRRFSLSPVRIYLMDFMIMLSAAWGYLQGMFSVRSAWWSNKTRRIRWKQFIGPIGLFFINALVVPLAYMKGSLITSCWAFLNASIFMSGFIYLNSTENYSDRYVRVPVTLFVRLFKIAGILALLSFAAYATMILSGIENGWQQFIYSVIILFIVNVLATFAITTIYILRENKKINPSQNS